MARPIATLGLALQTVFADLIQRNLDATFESQFPVSGRFVRRHRGEHGYWYFEWPERNDAGHLINRSRYVGRASDAEITARVEHFGTLKTNALERRRTVAVLRSAGLPTPPRFIGEVLEALADAGVFRLRATLVGTVAFQTYAGLLGVRLPVAAAVTADADIAQFHLISICVDDTSGKSSRRSIDPILKVLGKVDRTFSAMAHTGNKAQAAAFMNASGFKVEFLTPNRGSDDHMGKPTLMPALGGAAAEPLRFMDFLIYGALRSVLLHGRGVLVNVPAPERYAVHKTMLSVLRQDRNGAGKSTKDAQQAGILIEAMAHERRLADVGAVWIEAWEHGPRWRDLLAAGRLRLSPEQQELLQQATEVACREGGLDPAQVGYGAGNA